MKKVTLLIVLFLIVLITPRVSFAANTEGIQSKADAIIASPSNTLAPKSDVSEPSKDEYILPYPGILPDHPLYPLKNFRDSILEMLISDPVRKIEFYILQSDKEISASQLLSMSGKHAYVKQTIEHATKYKEKAFARATGIKNLGKEVPAFLIERLTHSIQKQNDIVTEMGKNADTDVKNTLDSQLEKLHTLVADIDSLKK